MGEAKPWQIILVVLAVGVLGYSVWKFAFNTGPKLPSSVLLVDVVSGELFEVSIAGRRMAFYPEKHPDTGDRTLLPVVQQDDGTWRISGHSLPALEDVQAEPTAVTNTSTGAVNVTATSPRRLRP